MCPSPFDFLYTTRAQAALWHLGASHIAHQASAVQLQPMRPCEALSQNRTQIRAIALRHRGRGVRVFGSARPTLKNQLDTLPSTSCVGVLKLPESSF